LHDDGRRQAAALAARLSGKPLDAVAASHLRRSVETAQPLADERGLEVEVIEDLQEVLLGEWSGGEVRRRAAVGDPEFLAWSQTGRWDGIPGCEGDDALRRRVRLAVDGLVARHPAGSVAVVAHGGVINAYLADILGIERSLWLGVENTSITV